MISARFSSKLRNGDASQTNSSRLEPEGPCIWRSLARGVLVLLIPGLISCPSTNVLLVTFDTLRADHTSLVAIEKGTTPNFVRLASRGIEFTQAYAPSSTTGPSHASLFTGLYPGWHSVVRNGIPLDDEQTTMAEWFRDRGYRTAAFVSSYVLNRRFGFDQGFEIYADHFSPDSSTLELEEWDGLPLQEAFDRRANETTNAALQWLALRQGDDQPFLLFVHYFDPHSPYVPPKKFAERFDADLQRPADLAEHIRRYDAEIAFADQQLGRLLDSLNALGKSDDTLVIATADHGEGLMDHGIMEHGALIYEPFVHIPLVMRLPNGERDTPRVDTPVSLVDLLPTIQSLATATDSERGSTRDNGTGRDLSSGLIGGAGPPNEVPIFFHRRPYSEEQIDEVFVNGERFAVRSKNWKYLSPGDGREAELYDLTSDPEEIINRVHEEVPIALGLNEVLELWRSNFVDYRPATVPLRDRQMLEALGYAE